MDREKPGKEISLEIAANLLYIACDFLKEGEVDKEEIDRIFSIAEKIDGIEHMETKPKDKYTKDELLTSVKAYRRLTKDSHSKRQLNNMLKSIEAEEALGFVNGSWLIEIVDSLPKYEYRKKKKKDFYEKAFTQWFKDELRQSNKKGLAQVR